MVLIPLIDVTVLRRSTEFYLFVSPLCRGTEALVFPTTQDLTRSETQRML